MFQNFFNLFGNVPGGHAEGFFEIIFRTYFAKLIPAPHSSQGDRTVSEILAENCLIHSAVSYKLSSKRSNANFCIASRFSKGWLVGVSTV